MGLTVSHGAFDRSYSTFHNFRIMIAQEYGFPPLDLMEGFYEKGEHRDPFIFITTHELSTPPNKWQIELIEKSLPIKWNSLKRTPLIELLSHSDCDGYINYGMAKKISNELISLLPLSENNKEWTDILKQFIEGCEKAYSNKEKLKFY